MQRLVFKINRNVGYQLSPHCERLSMRQAIESDTMAGSDSRYFFSRSACCVLQYDNMLPTDSLHVLLRLAL